MNNEEEWVTVAEAARRLGIAPRQARRYAAKLNADQRREPEGAEPLRVLFSAIVEARWRQDAAHPRDSLGTGVHPAAGLPPGVPPRVPSSEDRDRNSVPPLSLSAIKDGFFDQVVASQVALLAEKDERIADLQSALDHERETTQRLGEALAREQALRLLPLAAPTAPPTAPPTASAKPDLDSPPDEGPESPVEAPESPVEAPESSGGAAEDSVGGPEPPRIAPQSRWRALWRRVTGA